MKYVVALLVATISVSAIAQDEKASPADRWEMPFLTELVTPALIPQMGKSNPLKRTIRGFEVTDPVKDITVLRIDDIFSEFEFVEYQASEVKRLLKSADELRQQVLGKLIGVSSGAQAKELKQWYSCLASDGIGIS